MNFHKLTIMWRALFAFILLVTFANCAHAEDVNQITVFVEEGRHELNGHVFLSLSDGVKTSHFGFYSKSKIVAMAAMGGGEIRDDSATPWDVKRVYNISKPAYQKAFEGILAWKKTEQSVVGEPSLRGFC